MFVPQEAKLLWFGGSKVAGPLIPQGSLLRLLSLYTVKSVLSIRRPSLLIITLPSKPLWERKSHIWTIVSQQKKVRRKGDTLCRWWTF